jgi:hypothetical protein
MAVQVAYDPVHVENAVLEPGVRASSFATFFLGLLFVFVGSAALVPQIPLLFQRQGKRSVVELTPLLDGQTEVSSQQLVSDMLKVALLAHEQAGTVRFETEEKMVLGVKRSSSLVIVPTEKEIEWPSTTLEARLLLNRRANVSDVVFDWLAEESTDPWGRAAEQGIIMLVLRGFAVVSTTKWGTRKYVLPRDTFRVLSQTSGQPAEELLADCQRNRPEVWQLLDKEIEQAMKRRTHQPQGGHDHFQKVDPWLAESTADQERFAVHLKPVMLPTWITVLLGIVLSLFAWWLANAMELGAFAAVTAAALTTLGLLSLPFQSSRNIEKRTLAWVRSREPVPNAVPDPPAYRLIDRIAGLFAVIPILTVMVVFCRAHLSDHPAIWLLIVSVAGYGFYLWSRKKAAAAINARVMGGGTLSRRPVAEINRIPTNLGGSETGETVAPKERAAGLAGATPSTERSAVHRAMPIALEVVNPVALPPASQESHSRLEAISLRAPSMRSAYRKGITFLAVSTTLLAACYWLTGPSPFAFSPAPGEQGISPPERMPLFLLIALVVTLLLLNHGSSRVRDVVVGKLLSAVIGGSVTIKPDETDEAKISIRPTGLILVGGIWVMAALFMTPFRYASLSAPEGFLFSVASLAIALGYLYWIHRATIDLERRYPYQAPLSLLALRVFGSPNLSDFLDLTNAWQWIGTRQILDGPDTVGQKTRDLINYFTGRIDKSIVEDAQELREALAAFRTQPDGQLRFPVNSMQCSDTTWKEALQHLLRTADVVVMDLSSLSEKNRGIAHELGRLIDKIPLQHVVLLANDSTEMDVLTDILAQAWENMAADSPNHDTAEPRFRLYHMGGQSERASEESLYDWKRRQRLRLDENHLVCLLYDAAQPPRIPATVEPKRDEQAIRWGHVPMPPLLRRVRNILFVIVLLFILLISGCKIIGAA